MKKKLMILLGMITVIACIGLAACGNSDSEAEAPAEETAAEDTVEVESIDASIYGYAGEDPVEATVYEYAATAFAEEFDVEEGMVSIPTVMIIDKIENEDGSIDVTGDFWIDNYTIEGDTLVNQSGGDFPGKMHIVMEGDTYKVESFEGVGDGSEFEPTAKAIFGDSYDKFMEVNSDEDARAQIRTETVANFVKANNLEVTKYQDYGWDPVELPL
ncbi:MAG: hypothetical protein IJJ01_07925 [Firmicutes bacterium]|nr:hypothetical protein [Bacillota bacterium]